LTKAFLLFIYFLPGFDTWLFVNCSYETTCYYLFTGLAGSYLFFRNGFGPPIKPANLFLKSSFFFSSSVFSFG